MSELIYETVREAVYSDDFFKTADKLIEFVDLTMKEKYRKKFVDYFIARMFECAIVDYVDFPLSERPRLKYQISFSDYTVAKYLWIKLRPITTPVKMLRLIRSVAEEMKSMYEHPSKEHIAPDRLKEILEYLDITYQFSNRIFRDKKAMFLILNTAHKKFDSETVVFGAGDYLEMHFLLYCMTKSSPKVLTPEEVLFHELGHAVHARWTGDTNIIPDELIQWLKHFAFPAIDEQPLEKQKEILADVLAEGMAYKSPYEKYETFPNIAHETKGLFHELTLRIMDSISDEGIDISDIQNSVPEQRDRILNVLLKDI